VNLNLVGNGFQRAIFQHSFSLRHIEVGNSDRFNEAFLYERFQGRVSLQIIDVAKYQLLPLRVERIKEAGSVRLAPSRFIYVAFVEAKGIVNEKQIQVRSS